MSRSSPSAPARWQLAVLLAVLATILLSAFPYFELVRNANELPRLVQAMSLVEAGEWAIDGPSRRGLALGPDVARSPVDRRVYPNKPPGASVVGAAAYLLSRLGDGAPTLRELTWWARLLAGVVPALVIAAVAWLRLRRSYAAPVAAAAILLTLLATPLFSYARLFYGHALAACLVHAGVVALERGHGEGAPLRLGIGAGLAATAITVEYGAAFAGLPIAVMLLWPILVPGRAAAQRRAAALRAGVGLGCALIPVIALALYQRAVYGSAWATGYHHAADPGFAELHGQGLLGLGAPRWSNVEIHLLSPNTGLLAWSPVVILAVAGLVRLARGPGPLQRAARLQLAVFTVVLIMGLGLSFQGGWRVGPRYLVVALPMLILGLAEIVDGARRRDPAPRWRRPLTLVILGAAASWAALANSLAATLWPHIDPTNIAEPFGALLLPLRDHGFGPYGLPELMGGDTGLTLALPILACFAALAWALLRAEDDEGREDKARGRLALLAWLALGAALGVAGPSYAIPRAVTAHEKSARNLKYIERVYEPRLRRGGARERGESAVLAPLD